MLAYRGLSKSPTTRTVTCTHRRGNLWVISFTLDFQTSKQLLLNDLLNDSSQSTNVQESASHCPSRSRNVTNSTWVFFVTN